MSGWDSSADAGHRSNDYQGSGENINGDAHGHGGNYETQAGDGDGTNGSGGACRNCGQEGHFSRECPESRQMSGECFNCGEVGHNKADCPNPKVDRPFTGTCRYCEQEGHRAAECPSKPQEPCRNCSEIGHKTVHCEAPRDIGLGSLPEVDVASAWTIIQKAGADRDLDDFKKGVLALAKASPGVTYLQVEKQCRAKKLNMFLIAVEKNVPIAFTNVDLQGKSGCRYQIVYSFSAKPRRAKAAIGWPESAEENLDRLKDAGETMNTLAPVCRNCGELGHISKACTEEKAEKAEQPKVTCSNCDQEGHRLRDCKEPKPDRNLCRNCQQPGHRASDCTEPRSAACIECKRCSEMGHFAKDCPNNDGSSGRGCRNCGQGAHFAKECPEPPNPNNMTCRNCDARGHMSRECPKPKDWSRVKCPNCHEMGHGPRKCPLPDTREAGNDAGIGGYDNNVNSSGNDHGGDAMDSAPSGSWGTEITAGGW